MDGRKAVQSLQYVKVKIILTFHFTIGVLTRAAKERSKLVTTDVFLHLLGTTASPKIDLTIVVSTVVGITSFGSVVTFEVVLFSTFFKPKLLCSSGTFPQGQRFATL